MRKLAEDFEVYKEQRNIYKREILLAKKEHIKNKLESAINEESSHRAWRNIDEVSRKFVEGRWNITDDENETNRYLLEKYFPPDIP